MPWLVLCKGRARAGSFSASLEQDRIVGFQVESLGVGRDFNQTRGTLQGSLELPNSHLLVVHTHPWNLGAWHGAVYANASFPRRLCLLP